MYAIFLVNTLLQELYEFVFAVGGKDSPFTIVQTIPHKELQLGDIIGDLNLGKACVLTVVEKDTSPDPLTYITISVS